MFVVFCFCQFLLLGLGVCAQIVDKAATGELFFLAVSVNDYLTLSKFDNVCGCCHSLPDGSMRPTDVMVGGTGVFVCGYGDMG